MLWTRLPSPGNPDGSYAYLCSFSTEPHWRRHGLARAVLTALLEELDARGVARVELHASPDGEPLYAAAGSPPPPDASSRCGWPGRSGPLAYHPATMEIVGRGQKVFDHPAVTGRWQLLSGPDDVLALMDAGGGEGVVAVVRDAGATFLAPLYHELTGVVCTSGTLRSHIGIVAREFHLPCVVGAAFPDGEPADGATVELDCSGDEGLIRA